jgi:hypothetical protein
MLKPGERGRRGQGIPAHRIAPHRQLVQGIVGQPGRVIAVLIPTGQTEEALPQQVADRVPDLVRIPAIGQARRQAVRQLEAVIQRLESHDAAIRAGLRLIESRHRRRLGVAFEGQLRYTLCSHRGLLCAVRRNV